MHERTIIWIIDCATPTKTAAQYKVHPTPGSAPGLSWWEFARFQAGLRGLKLVPAERRPLVPPPAGNEHCWATKENHLRNIIALSLLLISLVSCSPSTISSVSTVTVTNTFAPTETKMPYPTLTPNPTATVTLSISATPSATPDAAIQILNSPDGKYIAKLYVPYNGSSVERPVIEIFDEHNKLLWQIPYQGEVPESDPKPSLTTYEWSTDNSQLYFYYVWSPDGGDWAFWWTGYDLQKIDVKTGKIQHVLPGQGFMSFIISPDRTQIAYTREQDKPSIIYVRDLVTGSVKKARVLSDFNELCKSW